MSDITSTDVDHTATLCRLKLNDAEKDEFTKEIGEILNYVDELNQVDAKGVKSISQISGLTDIARVDEVTRSDDRENLLSNAPETQDGYIKVKKVFE